MAEGLAGINIGNTADWGLIGILSQITGTVAFQGLIDTTGFPPKPGQPRPAYHALALVAKKLLGFSAVKPFDIGKGVYAYQFTVRKEPVYVLWYDDGHRYLPGDTEPTTQVTLSLPQRQYTLIETPIVGDALQTRTVAPSQGVLTLRIGTTPLFLEPTGTGAQTP
jgi:hypothetical protein